MNRRRKTDRHMRLATRHRPGSSFGIGIVAAACWLFLASSGTALRAQEETTAAPTLSTTVAASTVVRVISNPGSGPIAADELRLSVGGIPAPVTGIDSLADAVSEESLWDLLIYADAELSTADGLDRSAELLAAQADRLTDLGSVRIVVADPSPEILLDATRDSAAVAGSLHRLVSETVGTDRMVAARERAAGTVHALAGGEEAAARSAIRRENSLIERRQRTLLEWLAVAPSGRPRAVLLIADPPQPDAVTFFSSKAGLPALGQDPSLTRESSDRAFAQALASEGWAVFPIAQATSGDAMSAGLTLLANDTGGEPIVDETGLALALESMTRASRLRFTMAQPTSVPAALELRTRSPGLRLRLSRWVASTTPREVSAARARRTMLTEAATGSLPLTSAIVLSEPQIDLLADETEIDPEDEMPSASLESLVQFPARARGPADSRFRITVISRRLDEELVIEHHEVAGGDLSRSSGWIDRRPFAFDDDLQGVAVVIEELGTGLWGGDLAFYSETPLQTPNLQLAAAPSEPPPVAPSAVAGAAPTPPPAPPTGPSRRTASTEGEDGIVIRLLPPQKTSLTGKTRFRTLTTSPRIDRVVFSLDGVETEVDDDPPFASTLDLGSPARPHIIAAVALSASGRPVAEDSITVNQTGALFTVDITDVSNDTNAGTWAVSAEVDVPPADRLERVEFYWNETLQTTVAKPPYTATFAAPQATAQDYLRVVAYLAGGDSLEDVRLLAEGPVEEVDVNLVELYVVVADHNGVPVEGLAEEQFTILQKGRERTIERFDKAANVPLVMGLVVDTSSSMWALMAETKMAAAQFLGNSLTRGDEAFLIDFSTRPRLAHPQTGDLLELVRAFSTLQPAGFTALYDAIVFTMLQFEEGRGRKALVLLTDGDDYNSRFGPKKCIEYGRRLGVPVYIVALGGLESSRRGYRRADLENITEKTGGRVFYIASMEELPAAYGQINAELRNQYLLAFSTEDPLDPEELQDLAVTVDDPSLTPRTVVGGQQIY